MNTNTDALLRSFRATSTKTRIETASIITANTRLALFQSDIHQNKD